LLHAFLALQHPLAEPQQGIFATRLAIATVRSARELGEMLGDQREDARARGEVEGVFEVHLEHNKVVLGVLFF
jgi:hypothetical protein